jgi:hypothetical protein
MPLSPITSSSDSWAALWQVLTYQVPWSSNTAIVMRGTAILGLACGVVGSYLLLADLLKRVESIAQAVG